MHINYNRRIYWLADQARASIEGAGFSAKFSVQQLHGFHTPL